VRSGIPLSYSPLSKRGDRGDFPLYQRGLPAVSPALLDEGICVNILKTKDWPKGRGQAGVTTFLLAKNIF